MALNVCGGGREDLDVISELTEAEVAGVAEQPADLTCGVVVVDCPCAAAGPRLVGGADRAPVVLSGSHGVVLGLGDAEQSEASEPRNTGVLLGGSTRLYPAFSYPLAAPLLLIAACAVLAVWTGVVATLDLPISELVVGLVGIAPGAVVHKVSLGNHSDTLINVAELLRVNA